MIQVTLSLKLARLLHRFGTPQRVPKASARPFTKLFAYLKAASLQLQPVFPDTSDERLLPYFTLVATKPIPDTALPELLSLPGVEGAYRKPDDAPPGLP